MRAALIEPNVHRSLSYPMLAAVLPTTSNKIRAGRLTDSTAAFMAAYPTILGDTLAYLPVSTSVMASMVTPPSLPDALRRNRDALVTFARQWTNSEPSNADAFEALAVGLETRGELGGRQQRRRSTESSDKLARSTDDLARLAAMDVRLRVKRGEFDAARAIADSLINAQLGRAWSAGDAPRIAGLAAMTGRVSLLARCTQSRNGRRERRSGYRTGAHRSLVALVRASSSESVTTCFEY